MTALSVRSPPEFRFDDDGPNRTGPGGDAPGRRPGRVVLIADTFDSARLALADAVALAGEHEARLTVLVLVARVPALVGVAGLCPRRLADELWQEATEAARQLCSEVPPGLRATASVHLADARGLARCLLVDPSDMVVLGLRSRRGLLGRSARLRIERAARQGSRRI